MIPSLFRRAYPSHLALQLRPVSSVPSKVSNERFFEACQRSGIGFYTGVPDSLLKDFCAFLNEKVPASQFSISANEGSAVAEAVGFFLGTGELPLVYSQNSGFGNMINPLLSLAHEKVYGVPMVLLIGWRGEPGVKDEPQHLVMGELQEEMLTAMRIPYHILPSSTGEAEQTIKRVAEEARSRAGPVAILVRKGTFEKYSLSVPEETTSFPLTREQVLKIVTQSLPASTALVGTTGVLSRELYELREEGSQAHSSDFLCVGNMGHASVLASTLAMFQTNRLVACLDGDGAALMHLGALPTIGAAASPNFLHILVNNGLHESVGGQPTVGLSMNFSEVAKGCGYRTVESVSTEEDLRVKLSELARGKEEGPHFLEVKVKRGVRANLGRPKHTPQESKEEFMKFLKEK